MEEEEEEEWIWSIQFFNNDVESNIISSVGEKGNSRVQNSYKTSWGSDTLLIFGLEISFLEVNRDEAHNQIKEKWPTLVLNVEEFLIGWAHF